MKIEIQKETIRGFEKYRVIAKERPLFSAPDSAIQAYRRDEVLHTCDTLEEAEKYAQNYIDEYPKTDVVKTFEF